MRVRSVSLGPHGRATPRLWPTAIRVVSWSMTTSAVLGFARRMESDEELRQTVAAACSGDPARALAEVTRIAASAGFVFTPDELVAGLGDHGPGELADAELEGVSGGTGLADGVKDAAQSVLQNLSNMVKSAGAAQMTPVRNLRG